MPLINLIPTTTRYFFIKGFLTLIAALPFPILYLLSDVLFFFLYRFPGYRKKVVLENLRYAFPEKTEKERIEIARKFYANLSDMIVETIKLIHADYEEISRRSKAEFAPHQIVYKKGKNMLLGMSHQFSWEWGNWALCKRTGFKVLAFYTQLSDPVFEKILLDFRQKQGAVFIPTKDAWTEKEKYKDVQTLTVFIADQNPSRMDKCYWGMFLNRETPFQTGLERAAFRTGDPVIFSEIIKLKRGYYEERSYLMFENPLETKPGEITEAYVRFLEASIRRQPENWVWTHKRWKHKRV